MQSVLVKSSKMLGFIKSVSTGFSSQETITYLLKALVLSKLTYSSIIWVPFTQISFNELNAIVKKFLRHASFKSNNSMPFWDH